MPTWGLQNTPICAGVDQLLSLTRMEPQTAAAYNNGTILMRLTLGHNYSLVISGSLVNRD